jgi:hypothetical protein
MKAPNSKLQHPEKLQTPSSKETARARELFGYWNFSGAWMLELGAFARSAMP